MDQPELLWRQYEMHNELYKGYLDLVVKVNVFYYAITGAMISFYFVHVGANELIRWSLLFPLLMSITLATFFFFGAYSARITREEVFAIRDALGLKTAPEHAVLMALLSIFGVLMVVVAVGLGFLIWSQPAH